MPRRRKRRRVERPRDGGGGRARSGAASEEEEDTGSRIGVRRQHASMAGLLGKRNRDSLMPLALAQRRAPGPGCLGVSTNCTDRDQFGAAAEECRRALIAANPSGHTRPGRAQAAWPWRRWEDSSPEPEASHARLAVRTSKRKRDGYGDDCDAGHLAEGPRDDGGGRACSGAGSDDSPEATSFRLRVPRSVRARRGREADRAAPLALHAIGNLCAAVLGPQADEVLVLAQHRAPRGPSCLGFSEFTFALADGKLFGAAIHRDSTFLHVCPAFLHLIIFGQSLRLPPLLTWESFGHAEGERSCELVFPRSNQAPRNVSACSHLQGLNSTASLAVTMEKLLWLLVADQETSRRLETSKRQCMACSKSEVKLPVGVAKAVSEWFKYDIGRFICKNSVPRQSTRKGTNLLVRIICFSNPTGISSAYEGLQTEYALFPESEEIFGTDQHASEANAQEGKIDNYIIPAVSVETNKDFINMEKKPVLWYAHPTTC
ncbi:hypothetical protein ACP4OV_020111 [Aristida adscensionis]